MTRRSNDSTVELDAIMKHETEKGILLDFDGEEDSPGQWFAKSQVSFDAKTGKATMPTWMANKEGLI